MWECKLIDISQCLSHLTCTARFVDRDMFMRYLGYGIGHQYQAKRVGSFDEAGDQSDLDEDNFDLQNMARIASSTYVPPTSLVDTRGGNDDDPSAEDSDSDGSDDYDLNGHL